MSGFSVESFRSRVGKTFDVGLPAGATEVTVELTEVRDLAPGAASILFSGPADPVLLQGTYELRDADGETESMFIVPLGPRADEPMIYEAVINNQPAH
ncbi:MAG: hypothetical protein ACI88S_000494 [Ilumatobacter sp.]|jgi:hypothetical protein